MRGKKRKRKRIDRLLYLYMCVLYCKKFTEMQYEAKALQLTPFICRLFRAKFRNI